MIAEAARTIAVLETFHPPTFYIPPEAFARGVLQPTGGSSFCEWKGRASYFDIVMPDRTIQRAVWSYPEPSNRFSRLASWSGSRVGWMHATRLGWGMYHIWNGARLRPLSLGMPPCCMTMAHGIVR